MEKPLKITKPFYPSGPVNRTDPIVRHDPTRKISNIVKVDNSQNNVNTTNPNVHIGAEQENTRIYGVTAPVVKINNLVIDQSQISYFKITNTELLPELTITIEDEEEMINFCDVPSLDNVITVVLTAPLENVVKKITLDFYITECSFYGQSVTYNAVYKLLPLEQTRCEQIMFHVPGGCTAKWCKLPGNTHPTTYEFLHVIAEMCGLGFAASEKCKEIKDDRYRLAKSQKLKDLIIEHIEFGGIDENSIFDCWIDLFGYLVMVNIPYVMNEPVEIDEIASEIIVGADTTDKKDNIPDDAIKSVQLSHRTLSNWKKYNVPNNLMIESFEEMTDSGGNAYYDSTLSTFNIVLPEGNGGNNSVSTHQVQRIDPSYDGYENMKEYTFEKTKFSGFEMSSLTPTLKQKTIRDNFMTNFRSNRLKVVMSMPNYALERGMLVNIVLFEHSPLKKRKITQQLKSAFGDQSGEAFSMKDPSLGNNGDELDNSQPMLDLARTGMYYIDGIEYEYNFENSKITQVFYLVRKHIKIKYSNSNILMGVVQK